MTDCPHGKAFAMGCLDCNVEYAARTDGDENAAIVDLWPRHRAGSLPEHLTGHDLIAVMKLLTSKFEVLVAFPPGPTAPS